MKVQYLLITLAVLFSGCGRDDSPSAGAASEAAGNARSDGAVNGFILESSKSAYNGETDEWGLSADVKYSENEAELTYCYAAAHIGCGTINYELDENGRVLGEYSYSQYVGSVSSNSFEIKEDLIVGIPDNFGWSYTHNENGILHSIDKFKNRNVETSFVHNNAGQITHADFNETKSDGSVNETYYTHHYNDIDQLVRTEKITTGGVSSIEYQYDTHGNNTVEISYDSTGKVVDRKIFEYSPSSRRIVNLRLRDLIYFGFQL